MGREKNVIVRFISYLFTALIKVRKTVLQNLKEFYNQTYYFYAYEKSKTAIHLKNIVFNCKNNRNQYFPHQNEFCFMIIHWKKCENDKALQNISLNSTVQTRYRQIHL